MKTLKPITVIILFMSLCLQAQDVKNQSEIIRSSMSKGDYRIVADTYNSHRGVVNISDIKPDKNQPNMHFEISLKKYPNHARESARNATHTYFPDNIAFPVTYFSSYFEGNKKLQDAVGYVVSNGRNVGDDRIVFVGDYLFMLQNWKSKDDYEVRWVLKAPKAEQADSKEKPKAKKKGFFKSIKSNLKNIKSLGSGVNIGEVKTQILQPYLDEATKKQKTYYANWIKNKENAETKKYIEDKAMLMEKAIRQYNDDIFNSPEYQRMLAYQKWLQNNVNFTVYNKSDRTIWVGSSKESFITTKIEPGGSSVQTCTSDMYYYYSDAKGTPGTKFYNGNAACGSSVTIN
jgi:hypothetical protein